jgi:hypothetical protein
MRAVGTQTVLKMGNQGRKKLSWYDERCNGQDASIKARK